MEIVKCLDEGELKNIIECIDDVIYCYIFCNGYSRRL